MKHITGTVSILLHSGVCLYRNVYLLVTLASMLRLQQSAGKVGTQLYHNPCMLIISCICIYLICTCIYIICVLKVDGHFPTTAVTHLLVMKSKPKLEPQCNNFFSGAMMKVLF